MKDFMKRYILFDGRLNRLEYILIQITSMVLIILYMYFIYLREIFKSTQLTTFTFFDFLYFMLLTIPIGILACYLGIINQTKRFRDLVDKDLPILSIYFYFKDIPFWGWYLTIVLFTKPAGGLKNSTLMLKLKEKLNLEM